MLPETRNPYSDLTLISEKDTNLSMKMLIIYRLEQGYQLGQRDVCGGLRSGRGLAYRWRVFDVVHILLCRHLRCYPVKIPGGRHD